jgi:hypothetical protein
MWCKCDFFGNSRWSEQAPGRNEGVQLRGSVGRGGMNAHPDVLIIQRALNQIGAIAGGAKPPLAMDGICGPLTTTAIGRFQQAQFKGALLDHRIDPAGQTLTRLKQLLGTAPPVSSSGSSAFSGGVVSTAQTTPDQLAQARSLAIDAERRIVAAMSRLVRAQAAIAKPQRTPAELQLVREVDWHFKASTAPSPLAHLVKVAAIYTFMLTAIRESNNGVRELFQPGTHPDPTAIAFAQLGGFFSLIASERFIFITPQFRTQSSGVIVHELAHFCGGSDTSGRDIVHRASPKPTPRGTQREDGSTDYAGMVPFHALTNVFSYQVYCFPEIDEFKVP